MKHTIILALLTFLPWLGVKAQFNTSRLIISGRSALYYEDYVLSIQYFNQAITAKPHLYEPWFYRGLAKFYLDDFEGAEDDVTHAIELNPYISNMYELRGLARIRRILPEQSAITTTRLPLIRITRVHGITVLYVAWKQRITTGHSSILTPLLPSGRNLPEHIP